jgi:aspartyl-tRNA(Asn)/glutamyl-tRNA(Gln) amidotransferase subunit C
LPIEANEVRRIAALAKLDLDDEQTETFRHQLQSILDHVALLDELDVADVAPTASTLERSRPRRDDRVEGALPEGEALDNAPDTDAGHFLVPKVIP